MHPSQRPARAQQQPVGHYASNANSYEMFNLLIGPQLLDRVEALLAEHRERLLPPAEPLSMFLARVLSADGSCQQALGDAVLKALYRQRWNVQLDLRNIKTTLGMEQLRCNST